MMSGLEVNGQVEHMQNLASYSPEDYSYARTNDGVELINSREIHHHQEEQTEGSYPSPTSTISPHGTPHSRDPTVPISTSSELAFALEGKPTDQVHALPLRISHIRSRSNRDTFGKQTPGSRRESYVAYGDHLPAAPTSTTSHADAHGVIDRTATDHDETEFYTQQHQHETDGTDAASVYQQDADCTALNSHSHYIASSYSSLSDAYPGSTDRQMDYGQCVGGGLTYSPSAYGETLSSVLGHSASSLNGVTPESFASYST